MDLPTGKKIYFASDFHLGIPDKASSLEREKKICRWLDHIKTDAAHIYLVGDLFDAWFEYRKVVPKGYTRFFGKLAELADAGIPIDVFTGNHDLWMRGYFQEEFNIPVHHHPLEVSYNNKKFVIAHGDGLGPGDHGYKFLKVVLRNPVSQWLYRRLHPDTGVGMAEWFSQLGPKHSHGEEKFRGEQEWLIRYSRNKLKQEHVDYFIFGHRHIAIEYPLQPNSKYMNLGDWISYYSYAVFDGTDLHLQYFKEA
jgi:UDP-2,3-diacylglucosamine hydrolase